MWFSSGLILWKSKPIKISKRLTKFFTYDVNTNNATKWSKVRVYELRGTNCFITFAWYFLKESNNWIFCKDYSFPKLHLTFSFLLYTGFILTIPWSSVSTSSLSWLYRLKRMSCIDADIREIVFLWNIYCTL